MVTQTRPSRSGRMTARPGQNERILEKVAVSRVFYPLARRDWWQGSKGSSFKLLSIQVGPVAGEREDVVSSFRVPFRRTGDS